MGLLGAVALAGCQCGDPSLVRTYQGPGATIDGGHRDAGQPAVDAGNQGGGAGGGSGGGTGGGAGGGAGGGGGAVTDWCASDCDCPSGQRCVSTGGGELTGNACQAGVSTCTTPCGGSCAAGLQCVNGSCQVQPCVGTNCSSSFSTSVAGRYLTYYEFDIHDFASKAAEISQLLDLLSAVLSGQGANCANQTTAQGQLLCIVFNVGAQNLHAPPWVSQLLSVLSDAFKFGNKPIRARGVMQLAEGQNSKLYAAETWSEMWLEYNGQTLNVMNNPTLGQNGQLQVTVKAFGGTRSATQVFLGPRDIEFDVNKLLLNLFGVIISAATNNQAHDIESLIQLVLCSNLSPTNSNYLLCRTAAQQFANAFDLSSGLGGLHVDHQNATIYDLDNNGIADALGLPNSRGTVTGDMSNGFVSGALGPFPASSWYGTK